MTDNKVITEPSICIPRTLNNVSWRDVPMTDPKVAAVRETLISGGEIKVVYNHPWFWKCCASRVAKPEKKKRVSSDPYIMTDTAVPAKHTVGEVVDEALREKVVDEVMAQRAETD
jgi:hypothetical protein